MHVVLEKQSQKVNDHVLIKLLEVPQTNIELKNNKKESVKSLMQKHPKYQHLLKQIPVLRQNYQNYIKLMKK